MKLVVTPEDLYELERRIEDAENIGIDTESYGPGLIKVGNSRPKMINVYRSHLCGFSLAFEDGFCCYVPVAHRGVNAPYQKALTLLAHVARSDARVWAHNWKHDLEVFRRVGVDFYGTKICDSMVAAWIVDKGDEMGRYGLKALAPLYAGLQMSSFEEVAKDRAFSDLTGEEALKYAAEDSLATLRIGMEMLPVMERLGVLEDFDEVEMRFVRILCDMERNGIGLDEAAIGQAQAEMEATIETLHAEWDHLFPEVMISSPKQVSEYFFGEGLWDKSHSTAGKSGVLSVGAEVMAKQLSLPEGSKGRRAAELRMEYQKLSKLASTYTSTLVQNANQYPDNRLHGSFHHTGTKTGRLSSSYPNLQNIPAHGDLAKAVKSSFVPRPGWVYVSADYSQIELRVMAHFAPHGKLAEAYQANKDIHQQTADLVGSSRQEAKTLNFAMMYGAQGRKVAGMLEIPVGRAERFIKKYFEGYPEVSELKDRVIRAAERRGYVKTLTGRVRWLPDIKAKKRYTRFQAERHAFNTVIQGGAASLMKRAMVEVHEWCGDEIKIVGQVHDELLLECKEEHVLGVKRHLKNCMEGQGAALRVPLVAEPAVGRNWAECK